MSVCPHCHHRVPLEAHPLYWHLLTMQLVIVCLMIIFLYLKMINWAMFFLVINIIIAVAKMIVSPILQKFTVDTNCDNVEWRTAKIVFAPAVKYPDLFLMSTSVVQLRFEKNARSVPVRIEPFSNLDEKNYTCKISFIRMPLLDESSVTFSLEDNDKCVGEGRFVSQA